MLRIRSLEQTAEREVYAVRFLGGFVALPAAILVTVIAVVWGIGNDGLTGVGPVFTLGMIALGAFLVGMMIVSWRAVEVTIEPDRLLVQAPTSTILFNSLSYRPAVLINGDESIAPEPLRKASSSYGVVLSPSERVLIGRFPSRRAATTMAELLVASLSRVRGSADPLAIDP